MSSEFVSAAPVATASDLLRVGQAPLVPRAHLFVVISCATPMDSPSRHSIEGLSEVRIGRGSARRALRGVPDGRPQLMLSLADRHVSSQHARLVRTQDGWAFEDMGSKNGSFVNGSAARSVPLADADCLQIGHTLLIFRDAHPTPENAALDLVASARAPAFATLLPGLARELDTLALAATSQVPIMLVSETGTGKELLARAIHSLSRREGDFVPVNCGALPATLVESVLFGHKRGAFSGALADHDGLFRSANRGTLLLDEVGDMSPAAQAAVLRTLQDGEVLPVGCTRPVRVDMRIVSATHRDLEARTVHGTFREDLLARLSGFMFRLPSLRERREDTGLLVAVLLRKIACDTGSPPTLSPDAGWALLRYAWPRNVRELEKCLSRAAAVARDGRIDVEHLAEQVRRGAPRAKRSDDELREQLVSLMKDSGGNVSFAAKAMCTSRTQVHRWMSRFGIEARSFRR